MLTALARRAHALALCLACVFLFATTTAPVGCHPQPSPGDTPAVTPTSWVDTAETVDGVLSWALPASDAIVSMLPIPAETKAAIHRALGVAIGARGSFHEALVVYRQRGGDACVAHAASGALTVALVGVARALGDAGWGVAPEIERALTALGGLADELAQRCDLDAGYASVGAELRTQLLAIRLSATGRGVSLRSFPAIAPPDGGAR